MPIYDFDGAVHTEVGKLFDFDGTAKHQIGKVHDHDGTASSLIYSAETEALTSYAWGGHYNPNGAFQDASYSNGKIIANATSYLCQSIWTTEKIDFSQFSKMRVNYTISASSASGGYTNCRRIGFMANGSTTFQWDGGENANQSFGRSNFGVTHQHSVEMWETSLISVGTHDAEFDISGWSDSLLFGVVSMCAGNNTLSVTFNSIIFE